MPPGRNSRPGSGRRAGARDLAQGRLDRRERRFPREKPHPGLSGADEGAALKEAVFTHCLQPDKTLCYRWRAGDLLMWDNASVIHSATPAPEDQERTMLRTTVVGSVPV